MRKQRTIAEKIARVPEGAGTPREAISKRAHLAIIVTAAVAGAVGSTLIGRR